MNCRSDDEIERILTEGEQQEMMQYIKVFDTFPEDTARLTDAERGNLIMQLVMYHREGIEPVFVGNECFVFDMLKAQIDRDTENYKQICEKRRAAGSNGGISRAINIANANKRQQMQANGSKCKQDKDKDKDKDKDIKKSIKEKAKAFSRPTVEQVAQYIKEKGYTVDAEQFVSYYDSVGWKIGGKSPMKSWESALVTWQKREKKQPVQTGAKPVNAQKYEQRKNDLDGAFRQFSDAQIAAMMEDDE